jgi:hypothetical protein
VRIYLGPSYTRWNPFSRGRPSHTNLSSAPLGNCGLKEKIDNENTSKIDALGSTSLVLTGLTILILVAYSVCVLATIATRQLRLIPDWVFSALLYTLPLLNILSITVGIFARKRGSRKQKKVANSCIAVGILAIITGGGLFIYLINWVFGL